MNGLKSLSHPPPSTLLFSCSLNPSSDPFRSHKEHISITLGYDTPASNCDMFWRRTVYGSFSKNKMAEHERKRGKGVTGKCSMCVCGCFCVENLMKCLLPWTPFHMLTDTLEGFMAKKSNFFAKWLFLSAASLQSKNNPEVYSNTVDAEIEWD